MVMVHIWHRSRADEASAAQLAVRYLTVRRVSDRTQSNQLVPPRVQCADYGLHTTASVQ